jgi:hypothetical protein
MGSLSGENANAALARIMKVIVIILVIITLLIF